MDRLFPEQDGCWCYLPLALWMPAKRCWRTATGRAGGFENKGAAEFKWVYCFWSRITCTMGLDGMLRTSDEHKGWLVWWDNGVEAVFFTPEEFYRIQEMEA